MTFGPAIRVPLDASAALWIAPTLGSFGTVGGLVPKGYERYLLFDYRGGEPRGSEGVCRRFEQLVPVLARYTSTPEHCWFAIWEGYGFDTSMTLLAAMPRDDEERRDVERERQRLREDDAQRNKSIRMALSRLPSFDLPNRRYYLVCGAVTAASEIEHPVKIVPVIKCGDLERSVKFYTEVLDFERKWSGHEDREMASGVIDLIRDGAELQLSRHEGDGTFGSVNRVFVDDVDERYATFRKRGLDTTLRPESPIHTAPVDQTWGLREFAVTDPDGNALCFCTAIT